MAEYKIYTYSWAEIEGAPLHGPPVETVDGHIPRIRARSQGGANKKAATFLRQHHNASQVGAYEVALVNPDGTCAPRGEAPYIEVGAGGI